MTILKFNACNSTHLCLKDRLFDPSIEPGQWPSAKDRCDPRAPASAERDSSVGGEWSASGTDSVDQALRRAHPRPSYCMCWLVRPCILVYI